MKKILVIILCIIFLVGCNQKKENKEKYEFEMLTCMENKYTYYFYYENDKDYYYKAARIEEVNVDGDIDQYINNLLDNWHENYADSNMELEYKIEGNKIFISYNAFHITEEKYFNVFFKNRHNLDKNKMNESFNNKCLIKPIKK